MRPFLLLRLALLLAPGCVAVSTAGPGTVQIASTPSGAHFVTNTGHSGTTPETISVQARASLEVTLTKDGYQTRWVSPPRTSESNLAVDLLGAVLVAGLLGPSAYPFILDGLSDLSAAPEGDIYVVLSPLGTARAPSSQGSTPIAPLSDLWLRVRSHGHASATPSDEGSPPLSEFWGDG